MKVVQINSVSGRGSTGKICVAVSKLLTERGIENYILHSTDGNTYPLGIQYMSSLEVKFEALKAKVFGSYGFQAKRATKRLIQKIEEISPDIIHIHNIHGHNVNLEMFFSYLRGKKVKVFWTFHDCWSFTSYCVYSDLVDCNKWMTGCEKCPQRCKYSWFFDRSKWLYKKKREIFTGLDMTIITPSEWLARAVKKSFLSDCRVEVINNGIDLEVFRPRESNFRERYCIGADKKILLGVANKWEVRKGLDIFLRLAETLDPEKYQIVLVGTNSAIDRNLPKNIISIHRTANQQELAEIYSAADLFVNPTREDNFPTVNLEALACGIPVVTFDTGGSPECLVSGCGCKVKCGDFDALYSVIIGNTEEKFSFDACLARGATFNQHAAFKRYVDLYQSHE